MKELGAAINETLANSDQIAEVISRIKAEGYDVFLVLEATVGFSQAGEEKSSSRAESSEAAADQSEPELKVNSNDLRFLKSLRISVNPRSDLDKAA